VVGSVTGFPICESTEHCIVDSAHHARLKRR